MMELILIVAIVGVLPAALLVAWLTALGAMVASLGLDLDRPGQSVFVATSGPAERIASGTPSA